MKHRMPFTVGIVVIIACIAGITWRLFSAGGHVLGFVAAKKPMLLNLVVGEQRTYSVDYTSEGTADLTGALTAAMPGSTRAKQPSNEAVKMRVKGALITTVVKDEQGEFVLAGVINTTEHRLLMGKTDEGSSLAGLDGRLWWIRVNHHGNVTGLDLPDDLGMIGRNVIRAILGMTRLSLPEAGGATWQAEEMGLNGALMADYELSDVEHEKITVTKTLHPKKALDASQFDLQLEGKAEQELDSNSLALINARGHLVVEQTSRGTVVSHMTDTLILQGGDVQRQPSAALAALTFHLSAGVPSDLQGSDEIKRLKLQHYRELIAASPLSATLADADAQIGGSVSDVSSSLVELLKGHLALTPGAAGEVEKHLKAARTGSVPFKLYVGLLSFNGSEDAQEVLQRIIVDRETDPSAASTVIASLSMVPTPSGKTVEFLTNLANNGPTDDIKSGSFLALSSVGHTLNAGQSPDQAKIIYDKIASDYNNATTPESKNLALLAMGNIGREEQLAMLVPLLTLETPAAKREIAVDSLRFVGGTKFTEAEDAIKKVMNTDPEDKVRASAAAALGVHGGTPSAVAALANRLTQEHSSIVLQGILKSLGSIANHDVNAREALVKFDATCGTHDICNMAHRIVLSIHGGT